MDFNFKKEIMYLKKIFRKIKPFFKRPIIISKKRVIKVKQQEVKQHTSIEIQQHPKIKPSSNKEIFKNSSKSDVDLKKKAEKHIIKCQVVLYDLYKSTISLRIECSNLYALLSTTEGNLGLGEEFWIKTSQDFIQMLESIPEKDTGEQSETTWQKIQDGFTLFHLNWLTILTNQKQFNDIPLVLFAIQGRDLINEMLIQFNRQENTNQTTKAVLYYQKLRHQRCQIAQEHRANTLTDYNLIESTKINQIIFHNTLREAREQASKEAGYELLANSHDFLNLANIQSNPAFTLHQVLLVFLSINNKEGMFLIYKDKDLIWIEINGFSELLKSMCQIERYLNSTKSNKYHRGRFTKKTQKETALTDVEVMTFWSSLEEKIENLIWKPLTYHLKNISNLYILPQGKLFQIPFNLGSPSHLDLTYYPGLIYYHFKKTIIQHNNHCLNSQKTGILSYAPKIGTGKELPSVKHEIEQINILYQQNNKEIEFLNVPHYPTEPLNLKLLHFSGHGDKDPDNPYSTALLTGQDQYLGEQAIMNGQAHVQHAFLNACVLGMIRENNQGSPLGVVTGFLRQYTDSITTVVLPISDKLAAIFGKAWHKVWLQSVDKNPAKVLKQALVQFQKDDLTQQLINSAEEEGALLRDELESLLQPYFLSEKNQEKVWELVSNNNTNETKTITKIVDHIASLGCFNTSYKKQVSVEVGVLLYCFRVYGE